MQVGGNSRYGRSQNTGSKHSIGGASQKCQKAYKKSETANLGKCIDRLNTSSYNEEKLDLLAELKNKDDINQFEISYELNVDPEQGYQILDPERKGTIDEINKSLGPAPEGTFESLMPGLEERFAVKDLLDVYTFLKDAAKEINEGPSKESFSKEAFSKESFSKESFSKEAFGEMSEYGAKLQRTLSEESGKTDIESASTSSDSSYEVNDENLLNKEVKTKNIQDRLGKKWSGGKATPQGVIHSLLQDNPKWQAPPDTRGKKAVESHFDQIKNNLSAAFTNQQNESLRTMLNEIDAVKTETKSMLNDCKGNIDNLPEAKPGDQIQNSALTNATSYLTRASQ